MFGKRGKSKKGEATTYGLEHTSNWIYYIVAMVLGIIIIYLLKDKILNAIDYLKNWLRFGR